MPRSKELICTIIGILKTGACYVPLDPDYPECRLNSMVDDCHPKVIITKINHKFKNGNIIVYTDFINENNISDINLSNYNSLCYNIFTSGSTGKPKSCMIPHKSVMNVLLHFQKVLKISKDDKIWSLSNISFDIFVLETFLPLISGCKLLICPPCVSSNPVELSQWINHETPTILQATPTQLSLIAKHIHKNTNMSILVGGEPVTQNMSLLLLNITPNVFNVYGPSETTIWSTYNKITSDNITIGDPISNTDCIILNKFNEYVPKLCIGELYITGIGLSYGYYNKEELNNQAFIFHNNIKYYKTGDLVKQNRNGNIEYIGREDFQVKIRGHRIELEEVIRSIETYEYVKRAVVKSILKNETSYLIGYLISDHQINISNLFEHLRSILPLFMVPSYIIQLPRFPETFNGKIDMNKLPSPFDINEKIKFINTSEYIKPETEIEIKLHNIWSKILGVDEISVNESFYNVGFVSIMTPAFTSNIEKEFGIVLTTEQLIKNSTIRTCSKLLN